jgi:hypothetical protein
MLISFVFNREIARSPRKQDQNFLMIRASSKHCGSCLDLRIIIGVRGSESVTWLMADNLIISM